MDDSSITILVTLRANDHVTDVPIFDRPSLLDGPKENSPLLSRSSISIPFQQCFPFRLESNHWPLILFLIMISTDAMSVV